MLAGEAALPARLDSLRTSQTKLSRRLVATRSYLMIQFPIVLIEIIFGGVHGEFPFLLPCGHDTTRQLLIGLRLKPTQARHIHDCNNAPRLVGQRTANSNWTAPKRASSISIWCHKSNGTMWRLVASDLAELPRRGIAKLAVSYRSASRPGARLPAREARFLAVSANHSRWQAPS
jgi:hypothetical protein